MSPSVWGPMLWRWMHGAAYAHDQLSPQSATECGVWLKTLPMVLPCGACRASFKPVIAAVNVDAATRNHRLGRVVFDLHNAVNAKLNRPVFESYAIVKRRSQVWPVEFTEAEVFAMLFVVVLNFAANQERDKLHHYKHFLHSTEQLCRTLGRPRVADALSDARVHSSRPYDMFDRLHRAYEQWVGHAVPKQQVNDRYELCRSGRQ
jgi:hypothetical protein